MAKRRILKLARLPVPPLGYLKIKDLLAHIRPALNMAQLAPCLSRGSRGLLLDFAHRVAFLGIIDNIVPQKSRP